MCYTTTFHTQFDLLHNIFVIDMCMVNEEKFQNSIHARLPCDSGHYFIAYNSDIFISHGSNQISCKWWFSYFSVSFLPLLVDFFSYSRQLNHSIFCRLFGLKTLTKASNKTFHAEILSVNSPAGFDALLHPFALLLCFYTLAISTKYVGGAKDTNIVESNEFALQPTKAPRKKPIKHFALELLDFVRKHSNIVSNLMMMVMIWILLLRLCVVRKGVALPPLSGALYLFLWLDDQLRNIVRNSKFFSISLQQVWSIMYHSWLSFVFLLMANLLWILPVQSKRSLRLNFFVMIYANILLIIQYYFCLNLKENEFIFNFKNEYILNQIGFIRYTSLPCIPLLVKTLFMLTFCFTLRQQCRRTSEHNWKATRFSISIHDAGGDDTQSTKTSVLWKCINLAMAIMVRLWVWIILIIMFAYAVYGSQVTVFRTVYMALFLVFVNLFQVSPCSFTHIFTFSYWSSNPR